MEMSEFTEALERHLLTVLQAIDFDIVEGEAGGEIDIAADNWTIHFENGSGFLAIDSEPDEEAAYGKARREVMPEAVERAFAAADQELEGRLTKALEMSGDPFTIDFVKSLRTI